MRRSLTALNTEAEAIGRLLQDGVLDLLDGAQPTTPQTAITTQRRLVRLTLGRFEAPERGRVQSAPLLPSYALESGKATWFRAYESDLVTPVCDGTVSTADADLVLTETFIPKGSPVSLETFTYQAARG